MEQSPTSIRTVVSLTRGARVGVVVSLLFLIVGAYLFWSPIQRDPASGFPVKCGSAAAPPTDDLGKAACGEVNVIRRWQAGAFTMAALVVAVGSVYAFGVIRRTETIIGGLATDAETAADAEPLKTAVPSETPEAPASPSSEPN